MTDTSNATLDAVLKRCLDADIGGYECFEIITALRAERDYFEKSCLEAEGRLSTMTTERDILKAAKWYVQHVDTMNDMAAMEMARDQAVAERDAAYTRGVHDAADWLKEQSLTEDELQQGITFRDNYPEYAAARIRALADAPPASQCCMCGKKGLSTVEGDGGTECGLDDGRWVCSAGCYDRAYPDAPPAPVVGVKPLVWMDIDVAGPIPCLLAKTLFGNYYIDNASDGGFRAYFVNGPTIYLGRGIETAKAAIQADYEARVLSAMLPQAEGRDT